MTDSRGGIGCRADALLEQVIGIGMKEHLVALLQGGVVISPCQDGRADLGPAGGLGQSRQADIRRDPVEPRPEWSARLEAGDAFPGPQKTSCTASSASSSEPEHPVAMDVNFAAQPRCQRIERQFIAGLRGAD